MEDDFGEEVRNKLKDLKQREKDLMVQKQQHEERMDVEDNTELSNNIIQEASKYYLSCDEELTFDMKQELLRKVVREIRVSKDLKGGYFYVLGSLRVLFFLRK